MLPTSQVITLADSEYAQKRREIYKLLKKLTDLVGCVQHAGHDHALRYSCSVLSVHRTRYGSLR